MEPLLKKNCPYCAVSLRFEDRLLGRSVRCKSCLKRFTLTNEGEAQPIDAGAFGANTIISSASGIETYAGGNSPSAPLLPNSPAMAPASSPPFSSAPLGKLGRFELREVLGQGAFGRVYRAYDPQLDRFVALKVPTFGPGDAPKVQRFLSEAKAAAKLRHPNIVPTFDSGQVDGQYYIATQFVAGQPLSHRIEANPPDFRQTADWVGQLANALAYAHQEGIVHRDIKPDNIMLDEKGAPQIMDFGLAKRISEDARMTVDGSILGTPAYMPPEQARGELAKVGPHSDQYSLGVILFELLTGQRPFEGPPHSVIAQVIAVEPPSPRSLRREIPKDLEAICQKAMRKEFTARYATMSAMEDDVVAWLRGDAIEARSISSAERAVRWVRRNRVVAGLTALVALVAAIAFLSVSYSLWRTNVARAEAVQNARVADELRRDAEELQKRAEANLKLAEQREAEAKHNREEAQRQAAAANEALAKLQSEVDARKRADSAATIASQEAATAKVDAAIAADLRKAAEVAAAEAKKGEELVRANRDVYAYISQLRRAEEQLKISQNARALEILEMCNEEFRSWEWHFLRQRALHPESSEFKLQDEGFTRSNQSEGFARFLQFVSEDEVLVAVSENDRTLRAVVMRADLLSSRTATQIYQDNKAISIPMRNIQVLPAKRLVVGFTGNVFTGGAARIVSLDTGRSQITQHSSGWLVADKDSCYQVLHTARNKSSDSRIKSKDWVVTRTFTDLLDPRNVAILDSHNLVITGTSLLTDDPDLKMFEGNPLNHHLILYGKGVSVALVGNRLLFKYPNLCLCYDRSTLKRLTAISIPSNVEPIAVSEDSKYWYGIVENSRLQMFAKDGGPPGNMEDHLDWMKNALGERISFDNKRLIWMNGLFDIATGDRVHTFGDPKWWAPHATHSSGTKGRYTGEWQSQFSPSGALLVVGDTIYSMGGKPE